MTLSKEEISDLWDTITPKLYGYLINTLKDSALADDILQTTWIKVIKSLPEYSDRGYKISSWIFSIAKNEMRQHWRKNGREIPYDNNLHDLAQVETKDEDKIYIDQVIAKLDPVDQELLRLRYIADLPLGEISKLLNLNPVNVRVKMHRALSRARIILEKQNHE